MNRIGDLGERSLGDGLVLRTVRDEIDVDRYATFHHSIVSLAEGAAVEHLLRYHPNMELSDFFLIEDTSAQRIASTTCLIPWHCQIEDVDLEVAMLEMVVTHPDYRHKGLIRTQIQHFNEVVRQRGFDLTIIQGIPYYYRQFGYAYACDHTGRDTIESRRVAAGVPDEVEPIALRRATTRDIPMLSEFHARAMAHAQLWTLRSTEYWHYLIDRLHYPFQLVAAPGSPAPIGYILSYPGIGGAGAYIAEGWVHSRTAALSVLSRFAAEDEGEVQIGWPEAGPLVQAARSLGSTPLYRGQWLWRITDIPDFLRKLGAVFERRLAAGGLGDFQSDLCINLYRQAYLLRFDAGRLQGVESIGFVDASMGAKGGDLNIPPDAFVRLVLGYRNLDALRDAWPDTLVRPEIRPVLDALFPRMSSHFCMPYHVYDQA